MNKQKRTEIFTRLRAENPSPTTELNYGNPYQLLVAVALSAQSTDVGVNKATKTLFRKVKTPVAMLKLGEEGLREYIKTIGLYNTKAKNVIAAAQILVERHQGTVPDKREELEALPGVGRKTANLVLTEGFGIPAICVDTHVHRISNRFGYVKTRNPQQTEMVLRERLPKRYWIEYNALLVVWGQNVCKPVSPLCSTCQIRKYCARKGVARSR